MDGTDEDYCHKLEYNECEDDEYRCSNGMCIPGEYWLDGDYDCMDWSDEMLGGYSSGESCPYSPGVECEEHMCVYDAYSCGNGHCIYDGTNPFTSEHNGDPSYCSNYRELNFFCEAVDILEKPSHWTINGGYCVPNRVSFRKLGWDKISQENNCTFLLKCALTNGLDSDCPCPTKLTSCEKLVELHCPQTIQYPSEGNILAPYLKMKYTRESKRGWYRNNKIPNQLYFQGSIKCYGYQIVTFDEMIYPIRGDNLLILGTFEPVFCDSENDYDEYEEMVIYRNYSGPQYDSSCWNKSTTFNNRTYNISFACNERCISPYRLRDGRDDCLYYADEDVESEITFNPLCSGQQKYRMQCSASERSCLLPMMIATWEQQCQNGADEFSYENGQDLTAMDHCLERNDPGCTFFRKYIQGAISINYNNNIHNEISRSNQSEKIPFVYYCDSIFDTDTAFDESLDLCRNWICRPNEYRCLTGQCILVEVVCNGM